MLLLLNYYAKVLMTANYHIILLKQPLSKCTNILCVNSTYNS